jgi:N-glycosylase/DNA lyase
LDDEKTVICIEGIDKQTLDLSKTLDCGQCFRWNKLGTTSWYGVVGDKVYVADNQIIDNKPCIVINATAEEWENKLYKYFDLDTDYSQLKIDNNDKFALKAQQDGQGIRILKQDAWEATVSFIISQRNNIPKIKSTIDKFCKAFGNKIEEPNLSSLKDKEFYTFPDIDTICKLDIADLDGIGLGYRDEYILIAAHAIKNKSIDLDKLANQAISGELAVQTLMELKGVGPKVANCIALFGLHKLDMFPIDVWIQRIIDEYYNGNIDIGSYGKLAGLVQQYMFYEIKYGSACL